MIYHDIVLPSKPKVISEGELSGTYEIDGLYPGYGHTLGNSLRRIILSSLPGAAITSVKITGAEHEFSTLKGVKEDVITIILNLKRIRIRFLTEGPQTMRLKVKKEGEVKAGDFEIPGQIEIMNPELVIAHLTDKSAVLDIEAVVEGGLGYVPKEILQKNKVDIGTIALDAAFAPIRRVNYEVENMRVGDRTDFNRLKIFIETDGSITPKSALEKSIEIMINQLKAIVGFQEEQLATATEETKKTDLENEDALKTKIDSLDISTRTLNALSSANIKTIGGLARKKEKDLAEIEGLGPKGIEEIKNILAEHGLTLK